MHATYRDELTGAIEDYLKAIYAIGQDTAEGGDGAPRPAATTAIAGRLGVAPASVSAMIKRLADQGLVEYTPYQGVSLTVSGRRATLRIIRRHRVIESYLVHALGYAWEEVHDEAERLEHAISDLLVERMAAAMGDPIVDPHGAPIPTAEGAIDDRRLRSLADLTVGSTVRIARVADEDADLLRYLAELALMPGMSVTVSARAPFDGPMTLQLNSGEERVVGGELTRQVLVEEPGGR